jgi:hypothetical protein
MHGRRLLGALALVALSGSETVAQVPAGMVDVEVTVTGEGRALVEERYVIAPAPASIELRALMRPCADVRGVSVERDGTPVPVVMDRNAPWLVWLDTMARAEDALQMVVRYEVDLTARHADVPLLHLTAPIPQRDGEREGTVRLGVRFRDPTSRVRFPHMSRDAPTHWGAHFVAIPSFVEVAIDGAASHTAADCATASTPTGDDGGLVWRFLVFVGIMAAWVPLYLLWAGRSRDVGE